MIEKALKQALNQGLTRVDILNMLASLDDSEYDSLHCPGCLSSKVSYKRFNTLNEINQVHTEVNATILCNNCELTFKVERYNFEKFKRIFNTQNNVKEAILDEAIGIVSTQIN